MKKFILCLSVVFHVSAAGGDGDAVDTADVVVDVHGQSPCQQPQVPGLTVTPTDPLHQAIAAVNVDTVQELVRTRSCLHQVFQDKIPVVAALGLLQQKQCEWFARLAVPTQTRHRDSIATDSKPMRKVMQRSPGGKQEKLVPNTLDKSYIEGVTPIKNLAAIVACLLEKEEKLSASGCLCSRANKECKCLDDSLREYKQSIIDAVTVLSDDADQQAVVPKKKWLTAVQHPRFMQY